MHNIDLLNFVIHPLDKPIQINIPEPSFIVPCIFIYLPPDEMNSAGVVRDATPSSNMADKENTNMEVDRNKPSDNKVDSPVKTTTTRTKNKNNVGQTKNGGRGLTTTEYCEQLQAWMWQNYTGYVNWQSWLAAAAALPCPIVLQSAGGVAGPLDINPQNWHHGPFGLSLASHPAGATSQSNRAGGAAGGAAVTAQPQQLPPENVNVPRQGKLYIISKFFFCFSLCGMD